MTVQMVTLSLLSRKDRQLRFGRDFVWHQVATKLASCIYGGAIKT
jgi:hypothetical protein